MSALLARLLAWGVVGMFIAHDLTQPRASVTDFGVYDANVTISGDWSKGQPVQIESTENLKLRSSVTRVPCAGGSYWGFRVHLVNPPHELPVSCTWEIIHPEITSPDGTKTTVESQNFTLQPGEAVDQEFIWYFIDACPFEFVPGKWKMRVLMDGKMRLEKDFDVYKP